MYNSYYENGVILKPNVIAKGEDATVLYNGLLYHSGADTIYMHTGFGDNWTLQKDIQMRRTQEGFEAQLPIATCDHLNIVFKDSANNWDNNCSRNYSFEVQDK